MMNHKGIDLVIILHGTYKDFQVFFTLFPSTKEAKIKNTTYTKLLRIPCKPVAGRLTGDFQ